MSQTATDPATAAAAAPTPGELGAFLAARDVPCPGCGYNLRGNTTSSCPECGTPLVLEDLLLRPYRETAGIVATVAAAWVACVFSLPLFCTLVSVPYTLVCGAIGVMPHTKTGRRWLWLARDVQRRNAILLCWVFGVLYPPLAWVLAMFVPWL
jgi:hypothetical protein